MSKQKLIVLDVDQVVLDFLGQFIKFYNLKYNKRVSPDDITSFLPSVDMRHVINEDEWEEAFEEFESNGGYSSLQAIEGARTSINNILAAGHKIVFVTARHSKFRGETEMSFILNKIPLQKTYFVPRGKRAILKQLQPDFFVDDSIRNLVDAEKAGLTLDQIYVMTAPHNKSETKYNRISNLMQLERIILEGKKD